MGVNVVFECVTWGTVCGSNDFASASTKFSFTLSSMPRGVLVHVCMKNSVQGRALIIESSAFSVS